MKVEVLRDQAGLESASIFTNWHLPSNFALCSLHDKIDSPQHPCSVLTLFMYLHRSVQNRVRIFSRFFPSPRVTSDIRFHCILAQSSSREIKTYPNSSPDANPLEKTKVPLQGKISIREQRAKGDSNIKIQIRTKSEL